MPEVHATQLLTALAQAIRETYSPSTDLPSTVPQDQARRVPTAIRITDVMAYDGFLYLWPTNEGLTALQMSNAPVSPAALTITSAGNTATISSGGDFSTLVVAGDVITDTNAAGPNYGQQHVVTEVTGAPPVTTVTLDSAFQPDITTAGAAAIRWGTQTSTPT
jgi:hypothetical protein